MYMAMTSLSVMKRNFHRVNDSLAIINEACALYEPIGSMRDLGRVAFGRAFVAPERFQAPDFDYARSSQHVRLQSSLFVFCLKGPVFKRRLRGDSHFHLDAVQFDFAQ